MILSLHAADDPSKSKAEKYSPELLKKAEKGDPESQRKLGQCYLSGEGIEKNNEVGIKWLEKAANAENMNALVLLFGIYFKGECGTARDTEKGISYLVKVADKKTDDKQTQEYVAGFQAILGNFYETGSGIKKDINEAFKWYEKSANAGNALGEASLGALYYDGKGVSKDSAKAFQLFQKSAMKNDIRGMTGLAMCYYKGDGIEKDYDKAYEILKRIVHADDKQESALKIIGLCYYYGHGVEKNEEIAQDYFIKAKNSGANDVDAFIIDITQNATNACLAKVCGSYRVKGTNQNKTTYTGKALINSKDNHIEIEWQIDKENGLPPEKFNGVGFISSNNLCIYYGGKFRGAALYTLNTDHMILDGNWIGQDEPTQKYQFGTEQLFKDSK
jgi:TPR repeat protein